MLTNYNNYTFNIFKMNTIILTITSTNQAKKTIISTNKREKKNLIFIPMHLGLTCTRQKKLKSLKLCLSHTPPHSCSSLVVAKQKKYFLQTYTGDSLSLALSVSVEDLGFAFFFFFFFQFFLFAFSLLQSFSLLHCLCPLLLSFFNLFRFYFFAFHPFV